MSVGTRAPLRMMGAVISGAPNTSEVRMTRGGDFVFSSLSGVAVDTLVVSGPGRLNTVTRLTVASGSAVVFYDGNIATSGGPFAVSGHLALGTILQPIVPAVSGLFYQAVFPAYGQPMPVDMPFKNGLIAAPAGSGTPSFCASFSLENVASGTGAAA